MKALSPGLAQSCFELMDLTSNNAATFPEITSAYAYFGAISAETVVEMAQRLQWIHSNGAGIAVLTPSGSRLLRLQGYQPMLRQALLDYIEVIRPPWAQNATFGRARVLLFAGTETAQTFVEAGLADGTDDDVVTFWDALAANARGQKQDRLSAIGRQGERLTIAYETARTTYAPKWIAIENSADGYDVLSVVSKEDKRQLSIEVKATTVGIMGTFHVTRNEWDRSDEAPSHVFHLWNLNAVPHSLAVVQKQEMQAHIPMDSGNGCWEKAEIPFSTFASAFVVPDAVDFHPPSSMTP